MTIFNSYKLFKSYKEYYNSILENENENENENDIINSSEKFIETVEDKDKPDFYKWLLSQNNNMSSYINEASKIIDLFDISSYDNLELYDNVKIMNGPIDRKRLVEVMEKENFIFIG